MAKGSKSSGKHMPGMPKGPHKMPGGYMMKGMKGMGGKKGR